MAAEVKPGEESGGFMDLGLKGKTALVTGASRGIGFAIARVLAENGCRVAICARNREDIQKAVKELEGLGVEALGIQADVLQASDIQTVTQSVVKAWGTVHILVNNAGGGGRWGSTVEATGEDVWMDVFNKNALAAVRFTRWAIPLMRKQKWGRVVTLASVYGREGGGRPWFNMAKSAGISLMKTLAMDPELVRDNLTFNSVAPGAIMIPGTGWDDEKKKDPASFEEKMKENFPLGRLGTPEEVADVVAFICSQKASLMNGACVAVDGAESRSF